MKLIINIDLELLRLLRKVNLPLNPPEASLGASSKGDFCIVLNFSVSP
jgi:hypothetical protein